MKWLELVIIRIGSVLNQHCEAKDIRERARFWILSFVAKN